MTDITTTAARLRAFVERIETVEAEIKAATEDRAEIYAEAKGEGFDGKVLKRLIALRKRKADDLAEEEAILELYKSALDM